MKYSKTPSSIPLIYNNSGENNMIDSLRKRSSKLVTGNFFLVQSSRISRVGLTHIGLVLMKLRRCLIMVMLISIQLMMKEFHLWLMAIY